MHSDDRDLLFLIDIQLFGIDSAVLDAGLTGLTNERDDDDEDDDKDTYYLSLGPQARKARLQAEKDLFAGKRHYDTSGTGVATTPSGVPSYTPPVLDGETGERVSDAELPIYLRSNTPLYDKIEGGFTRKDVLKSKVGLSPNDSWRAYLDKGGYVPPGWEEASKLLYAEERREELFDMFDNGEISEEKYLLEAYGKDIMRYNGDRVGDADWWWTRAMGGDFSDPLDNPIYLSDLLNKAKSFHEESERVKRVGGQYLFQSADGEEMTMDSFEKHFGHLYTEEEVEQLGGWSEMLKKMRGEYLPGFNPFIDSNGDGLITNGDYYLHTDGRTYKLGAGAQIEKTDENGIPAAVRVGGESQATGMLRNFFMGMVVDPFFGIAESVATLGAFIGDLFTSGGKDLDLTKKTQTEISAWKAQAKIGNISIWNDNYWTSGAVKDSNDQMLGVSRTVGAITGMILISVLTGGAIQALEGAKAGATVGTAAGQMQAGLLAKSGTRITAGSLKAAGATSGLGKIRALNAAQKSVGFVSKFFSFSNGTVGARTVTGAGSALHVAKMWGRAATASAILTIRDIGDNAAAAALYNDMLPEDQRRSNEDILRDVFTVAGINFALTTVLRQTWDDVGATQRVTALTGARSEAAMDELSKLGEKATYNALIRWANGGGAFNALVNTFADTAEMALTMVNNQFAQQHGWTARGAKPGDKAQARKEDMAAWTQTFGNYLKSPSAYVSMLYSSAATFYGGFGRKNLGARQAAYDDFAQGTASYIEEVTRGFDTEIETLRNKKADLEAKRNALPGGIYDPQFSKLQDDIINTTKNIEDISNFYKANVVDALEKPENLVKEGGFVIKKNGNIEYHKDAEHVGKIEFEGNGRRGSKREETVVYSAKPAKNSDERDIKYLSRSFTGALSLYKLGAVDGVGSQIIKDVITKNIKNHTIKRYAELNSGVAYNLSQRAYMEGQALQNIADLSKMQGNIAKFKKAKETAINFIKKLAPGSKKWAYVLSEQEIEIITNKIVKHFENPALFLDTSNMRGSSMDGYNKLGEYSKRFKTLTPSEAVEKFFKGDDTALEEYHKYKSIFINQLANEIIAEAEASGKTITQDAALKDAEAQYGENMAFIVHTPNKTDGGGLGKEVQDMDGKEIPAVLDLLNQALHSPELVQDISHRPFDLIKTSDGTYVIVKRFESSPWEAMVNSNRTTALLAEAFNLKNAKPEEKLVAMDKMIQAIVGGDTEHKVTNAERINFLIAAMNAKTLGFTEIVAFLRANNVTAAEIEKVDTNGYTKLVQALEIQKAFESYKKALAQYQAEKQKDKNANGEKVLRAMNEFDLALKNVDDEVRNMVVTKSLDDGGLITTDGLKKLRGSTGSFLDALTQASPSGQDKKTQAEEIADGWLKYNNLAIDTQEVRRTKKADLAEQRKHYSDKIDETKAYADSVRGVPTDGKEISSEKFESYLEAKFDTLDYNYDRINENRIDKYGKEVSGSSAYARADSYITTRSLPTGKEIAAMQELGFCGERGIVVGDDARSLFDSVHDAVRNYDASADPDGKQKENLQLTISFLKTHFLQGYDEDTVALSRLMSGGRRAEKSREREFLGLEDANTANFSLLHHLYAMENILDASNKSRSINEIIDIGKDFASIEEDIDYLKKAQTQDRWDLEVIDRIASVEAKIAEMREKYGSVDPIDIFDPISNTGTKKPAKVDYNEAKKVGEKIDKFLDKAGKKLPTKKDIVAVREAIDEWRGIFGNGQGSLGYGYIKRVEGFLSYFDKNFGDTFIKRDFYEKKIASIPGAKEVLRKAANLEVVSAAINDPNTSITDFKSELVRIIKNDYATTRDALIKSITDWQEITDGTEFSVPENTVVVDLGSMRTYAISQLQKQKEYTPSGEAPAMSEYKEFSEAFGSTTQVFNALTRLSDVLRANEYNGHLVFNLDVTTDRDAFYSLLVRLGYDEYTPYEKLPKIPGVYYNTSSDAYIYKTSKYNPNEDFSKVETEDIRISADLGTRIESFIEDTALNTILIDGDSTIGMDTIGDLIMGYKFARTVDAIDAMRSEANQKLGKKASLAADVLNRIITNADAAMSTDNPYQRELIEALVFQELLFQTKQFLSSSDSQTRQPIIISAKQAKELESFDLGYKLVMHGENEYIVKSLDANDSKLLEVFFTYGADKAFPINMDRLNKGKKNVEGYGTALVVAPDQVTKTIYENAIVEALAPMASVADKKELDSRFYNPLEVLLRFDTKKARALSYKKDELAIALATAANENGGYMTVETIQKVLKKEEFENNFYALVLGSQIRGMMEHAGSKSNESLKFLAVDEFRKILIDNIGESPEVIYQKLQEVQYKQDPDTKKEWKKEDIKLSFFMDENKIVDTGDMHRQPTVTVETARQRKVKISEEQFNKLKDSITIETIENIKNASIGLASRDSDGLTVSDIKNLKNVQNSEAKAVLARAYRTTDDGPEFHITVEDLAYISDETLDIIIEKLQLSGADKDKLKAAHKKIHEFIYGDSETMMAEAINSLRRPNPTPQDPNKMESDEQVKERILNLQSEYKKERAASYISGPSITSTQVDASIEYAVDEEVGRLFKQAYLTKRRREGDLTRSKIQSINAVSSSMSNVQDAYERRVASADIVENSGSRMVANLHNNYQRAREFGGFSNVYNTLKENFPELKGDKLIAKTTEIMSDIGTTQTSGEVYAVHMIDKDGNTTKAVRTRNGRLDDMEHMFSEFARLDAEDKAPEKIIVLDRSHSAQSGQMYIISVTDEVKSKMLDAYAEVLLYRHRDGETYEQTASRLVPHIALVNNVLTKVCDNLGLPHEYKSIFMGDPLQMEEAFRDGAASSLKEGIIGRIIRYSDQELDTEISREAFKEAINKQIQEVQAIFDDGFAPRLCPLDILDRVDSLRDSVERGVLDKYREYIRGKEINLSADEYKDFVLAMLLDTEDSTFLSATIRAMFSNGDELEKRGKGLPSSAKSKNKAWEDWLKRTKGRGFWGLDSEWVTKKTEAGEEKILTQISFRYVKPDGNIGDTYTVTFDISKQVEGWDQEGSENNIALADYINAMRSKFADKSDEWFRKEYLGAMFKAHEDGKVAHMPDGEVSDDKIEAVNTIIEIIKSSTDGKDAPIVTWYGSGKGSDLDVIKENGMLLLHEFITANNRHIDAMELIAKLNPDHHVNVSKGCGLDDLHSKLFPNVDSVEGAHTAQADVETMAKIIKELLGTPDNPKEPLSMGSQYDKTIAKIITRLKKASPEFAAKDIKDQRNIAHENLKNAIKSINEATQKEMSFKNRNENFANRIINHKTPSAEKIRQTLDVMNWLYTTRAMKAFNKTIDRVMSKAISVETKGVIDFFSNPANNAEGIKIFKSVLFAGDTSSGAGYLTKMEAVNVVLADMYGKEIKDGVMTLNVNQMAVGFQRLLSDGDTALDTFFTKLKEQLSKKGEKTAAKDLPATALEFRNAKYSESLETYLKGLEYSHDSSQSSGYDYYRSKNADDLRNATDDQLIAADVASIFYNRTSPIMELVMEINNLFSPDDKAINTSIENWYLRTMSNMIQVPYGMSSANINTYLPYTNEVLKELDTIVANNGVAKDRLYQVITPIQTGARNINGIDYDVDSFTMIISRDYAVHLLGEDYKDVYMVTDDNGHEYIYLPVHRQPHVRPDSNFWVKTIVDEKQSGRYVQMSKTLINGLTEGDFDSDHIMVFKPTSPEISKKHGPELARYASTGAEIIRGLTEGYKIEIKNKPSADAVSAIQWGDAIRYRAEMYDELDKISFKNESDMKIQVENLYGEATKKADALIKKHNPDLTTREDYDDIVKAFVDIYFCKKVNVGSVEDPRYEYYTAKYHGSNSEVEDYFARQSASKILKDGLTQHFIGDEIWQSGLMQKQALGEMKDIDLDKVKLWTKAISIDEEMEIALQDITAKVNDGQADHIVDAFAKQQGLDFDAAKEILKSYDSLLVYIYEKEQESGRKLTAYTNDNKGAIIKATEEDRSRMRALKAVHEYRKKISKTLEDRFTRIRKSKSSAADLIVSKMISKIDEAGGLRNIEPSSVERNSIGKFKVFVPKETKGGSLESASIFYNNTKNNEFVYTRKYNYDDKVFYGYDKKLKEARANNETVTLDKDVVVDGKRIPKGTEVIYADRDVVFTKYTSDKIVEGQKIVSGEGEFKTMVVAPSESDEEYYNLINAVSSDYNGVIISHQGIKPERWTQAMPYEDVRNGVGEVVGYVFDADILTPGFEDLEWTVGDATRQIDYNTLLLGSRSAAGLFMFGGAVIDKDESGKIKVSTEAFTEIENMKKSANCSFVEQTDATGLYQRLTIQTLVKLAGNEMPEEERNSYMGFVRNKKSLDKNEGQRKVFAILQKYFKDNRLDSMDLTATERELLSKEMFMDVYGVAPDHIDKSKIDINEHFTSKRNLADKAVTKSSYRVGEGKTSTDEMALKERGRIPDRKFGMLDFVNRISLANGYGMITDAQALKFAKTYAEYDKTKSRPVEMPSMSMSTAKAGYAATAYAKYMSMGMDSPIEDYEMDSSTIVDLDDNKRGGKFRQLSEAIRYKDKDGNYQPKGAKRFKSELLLRFLMAENKMDKANLIDHNAKTQTVMNFGDSYYRMDKDVNNGVRIVQEENVQLERGDGTLKFSEVGNYKKKTYSQPVAAKEHEARNKEFAEHPLSDKIKQDQDGKLKKAQVDLLERMTGVSSATLRANTEAKAAEDADRIAPTIESIADPRSVYKTREIEDAEYVDVTRKYTLGNYGLRFSPTEAGAQAFSGTNELRDDTSFEMKTYINEYGQEMSDGLFDYGAQRNALAQEVVKSKDGAIGLNKYITARAWLEDLDNVRATGIGSEDALKPEMKRLGFNSSSEVEAYVRDYEIRNAPVVNYGMSMLRTLELTIKDINSISGALLDTSLLHCMRVKTGDRKQEKEENKRRVISAINNLFGGKDRRKTVSKVQTAYTEDNIRFGDQLKKFTGESGYIDFISNMDSLATDLSKTQAVMRCAQRLPKNNKIIVEILNSSLAEYFERNAEHEGKIYSSKEKRASMFLGINSRFNSGEIILEVTDDAFKDYGNSIKKLREFIIKQQLGDDVNWENLGMSEDLMLDPTGSKAKAYDAYVSLQELYISALSTFKGLAENINTTIDDVRKSEGAALVDWFGRKIPEPGYARSSWANNSQAVVDAVKDLAHTDYADWQTVMAVKALSGELYLMDKTLANKLEEHVFTAKLPGPVMSVVQKTSRWASKMLMSQPLKLLRRLMQFSSYDLVMLSTANPKTGMYVGRARAELSAYFQSKGAVLSDGLKQYLHDQGFDYKDIKGYDPVTMEKTGSGEKFLDRAYFNKVNETFSYQNLWMRYAFYMAEVESFESDKPYYGVMYHQKGLIDRLEDSGKKAIAVLDATIGGPKGFSELSGKLAQKGFVFTTFPLAVARWATEGAATAKAILTNSIEGATFGDKFRALGSPIIAMGASYAIIYGLITLFCNMMGMDEEDTKELAKNQEFIDPINSILNSSVVTVSDNSIWSLQAILDSFDAFKDSKYGEERSILQKGFAFVDDNFLSKFNPVIRSAGEVALGMDAYRGNYQKNDYTVLENAERKLLGYVVGTAGANAIVDERKRQDDSISNTEGLKRQFAKGIAAEFGNNKAYKKDKKNYASCKSMASSFLSDFYDETNSVYFGDEHVHKEEVTSLSKQLQKAMLEGAHLSELQKILVDASSNGMSRTEITRAVRSISLQGKLEKIQELGLMEAFTEKLTPTMLEKMKQAVLYEDGQFPYIDDLLEFVGGGDSSNQKDFWNKARLWELALPKSYTYYNRNRYSSPSSSYYYTPSGSKKQYSRPVYYNSSYGNSYSQDKKYYNPYYTKNNYDKYIPTIPSLFVKKLTDFTGRNPKTMADLIGNYYENYYDNNYNGEMDYERYRERRNAKPKNVDWRN